MFIPLKEYLLIAYYAPDVLLISGYSSEKKKKSPLSWDVVGGERTALTGKIYIFYIAR